MCSESAVAAFVRRASLVLVDGQADVLRDVHPTPVRGNEQDSDHGEDGIDTPPPSTDG
jgi:hypothetical protein